MDIFEVNLIEVPDLFEVEIITGTSIIVNSNGTYNAVAYNGQTFIIPDTSWTDSDGTPMTTPATLPIVCTPPVTLGVDIVNTDLTLNDHANDGDTYVVADTIVKNTLGTTILTQPSGTSTGVIADSVATNSDNTFSLNIPAETNPVLANVTHIDSTGLPVVWPGMKPFVATPAPPSGWWQRPSDWLPIDNLVSAGDNKIVGLYAIFPNDSAEVAGNTLKIFCSFSYTVNWGDGLTENISGNVEAIHTYDYDMLDIATLTSEGFKQIVITITGNGNNLDGYVQLGRPASLINCVNWLDLRISGENITSISLPANYYSAFRLKKFVFLGATYNGLTIYGPRSSQLRSFSIDYTNLSSLSFMFYYGASFDDMGDIVSNATSIGFFMSGSYARRIGDVILQSATTGSYAFNGCRVDEIGNIDLRAATNTSGLFQDSTVKKIGSINIASSNSLLWGMKCAELVSPIVLITSALLADCGYAFYAAANVPEISLSDASGITNTTGMFASCNRLAKLRLPGMKTSFSVAGCNMGAAALNTLFNDMADLTGLPSQTMKYSGNPGAATADASILTAKNWVAS